MQQAEKLKQDFARVVWVGFVGLIVLLWLMVLCHNYGLKYAPKRIRLFKPIQTQNQPLISYHIDRARARFVAN